MRLLVAILVLCFALQSCERDGCKDVDVQQLLDDAPDKLQTYLEMREEVLAIEEYKNKFDEKGSVSFWSRDSIEISQYHLPILEKWLNEHGYVGFNKDNQSFSYFDCAENAVSINARVYQGERKFNYHDGVEILDSLYLVDGWYVHVTKCWYCGD